MKKYIGIFLSIIILLTMLTSCGYTDIAEFEYTQDENGITITKYIGTSKKVKIPDNIDGISVVAIGPTAFYENETITSVVLPETIQTIGNNAFYNCTALKKVNFPEGLLVIGESAFSGCYELKEVALPSTVNTIYSFAFSFCDTLTGITVAETNPNFMSIDGVLYSKDGTSLLIYPSGKPETTFSVPEGVITIGDSAFSYCYNLSEINLSSTVTTLGNYSFLDSMTINQTVTTIGINAFSYCESLTISCYEGSPVQLYARENGIEVNIIIPEEVTEQTSDETVAA